MIGGVRGWSIRIVTFVLFLAALSVWSIAMPRFAAPDENAHIIKAWGMVHGDPGRVDPTSGFRVFTVPAFFKGEAPCYAFVPTTTADCLGPDSGPDHDTYSSAANYPPLFYVLVGAPALFASGDTMLLLMRLLSAAWVALFLALAVGNLARIPRPAPYVLALLIVLNPVVFFLGATVNPSGLSIAAALAAWTAGIALVRQPPGARLGRAIDLVGLPICVLILLRRDSVLWAALILVTLAALSRPDVRGVLIRARRAWLWGLAIVGCSVFQLKISGAESASAALSAQGSELGSAIGTLPSYIQQMLGGKLGWLDTTMPNKLYLFFDAAVVALVVVAWLIGRIRVNLVMTACTILTLALPVAILVVATYTLQGRYFLPFSMCVPLLASAALVERRWPERWPVAIGVVASIVFLGAQVIAFAWTMRRFTSGAGAPWWFQEPPPWEPALSPTLLVMLDVVFFGLMCALIVWRLQSGGRVDEIDEQPVIDVRESTLEPAFHT